MAIKDAVKLRTKCLIQDVSRRLDHKAINFKECADLLMKAVFVCDWEAKKRKQIDMILSADTCFPRERRNV